jgi:predicted nucleic acid-binding protein
LTTVVLDASVAAKWALPGATEPLLAEANTLLEQYLAGRLRFLVPDIFWAEIANVLWKSVRHKNIADSAAHSALTAMVDRSFSTVPSTDVLQDALSIALQFDRPVYDGIYVALAVSYRIQLITADERLANALAAHFPIKWLGLY